MLQNKNGKIIDESGKQTLLKGVNLGGWLMMEGYLLGGRNIAVSKFLSSLQRGVGKIKAVMLINKFWSNFITESDFKNIKNIGFNCIRLPFHHKLFAKSRFSGGLKYLHNAVALCRKYRLRCILDMHAAPGCQNEDWHADSSGKSFFWADKNCRNKAISIWEEIADKYKNEPAVAGYNLLNEPVTDKINLLKKYYTDLIKVLRKTDKNHLIFLDGVYWSTNFSFLDRAFEGNTVISPHFYQPMNFVFDFVPDLAYPGRINNEYWNKKKLRVILKQFYDVGRKFKLPVHIGEFGITVSPSTPKSKFNWLKDTLQIFDEFGFHWTYWTYKSIFNFYYPNGIYQYIDNPPWIKREGPHFGWESYAGLNNKQLNQLYDSWKTQSFRSNRPLLSLLMK